MSRREVWTGICLLLYSVGCQEDNRVLPSPSQSPLPLAIEDIKIVSHTGEAAAVLLSDNSQRVRIGAIVKDILGNLELIPLKSLSGIEGDIRCGNWLEVIFPPGTALPKRGGTGLFPILRAIIPLEGNSGRVDLPDGRATVVLVYQQEGQVLSSGPFGTAADLEPLRKALSQTGEYKPQAQSGKEEKPK